MSKPGCCCTVPSLICGSSSGETAQASLYEENTIINVQVFIHKTDLVLFISILSTILGKKCLALAQNLDREDQEDHEQYEQ